MATVRCVNPCGRAPLYCRPSHLTHGDRVLHVRVNHPILDQPRPELVLITYTKRLTEGHLVVAPELGRRAPPVRFCIAQSSEMRGR
jgi:hypothetical protein